MASTADNIAFSARLKLALTRSRRKIETPSQLAQQFNLRYQGAPISKQAAQKWMAGESRPTPEKIAVLASMFNVSEQWLRLGISDAEPRQAATSAQAATKTNTTPSELELLTKYRQLSAHQQGLITDLVDQITLGQRI
jgi:hypothetical protein